MSSSLKSQRRTFEVSNVDSIIGDKMSYLRLATRGQTETETFYNGSIGASHHNINLKHVVLSL